MAPHTQRERGREIVLQSEWKSRELSWVGVFVFIYLRKNASGRMLCWHIVTDYSNLYVNITGLLHFTVGDIWGILLAATPSLCCLPLQSMPSLHCSYHCNYVTSSHFQSMTLVQTLYFRLEKDQERPSWQWHLKADVKQRLAEVAQWNKA